MEKVFISTLNNVGVSAFLLTVEQMGCLTTTSVAASAVFKAALMSRLTATRHSGTNKTAGVSVLLRVAKKDIFGIRTCATVCACQKSVESARLGIFKSAFVFAAPRSVLQTSNGTLNGALANARQSSVDHPCTGMKQDVVASASPTNVSR